MSDAGRTCDFAVGPFRESAAAWLSADDHSNAITPSPASTVLLLRGEPLEVFMIERSAQMEFAPSTWVFPGGRVDPSDAEVHLPSEFDAHVAAVAHQLGESHDAVRAWLTAAVRELFEEAGVLLASAGADGVVGTAGEAWAEERRRLESHETSWVDVLGDAVPRVDLMAVVDRWITPEFERRRYDTLFFLAALPDGARAEAVSREAQRGGWKRPQDMLDSADRGEIQLLPPTRTRLLSLVRVGTVEAALSAAGGPVVATRPWAVSGSDGPFLRAVVNP